MTVDVSVRPASAGDLPAVAAIYGFYVETSVISFEVEPLGADAWRERFDGVTARGLPFLVAETDGADGGGDVVGYAYAAPWKPRIGYRFTVENTIYLAPSARGRGIGPVLLDALLTACTAAGVQQVIAVIADTGDPTSVALHARAGFRHAGRLDRVGYKRGRWIDTVLMQRGLAQRGPAQRGPAQSGPA